MDQIGTHVGMWLGNNQGNFQLHRFTTNENIATKFFGDYFSTHCTVDVFFATVDRMAWPPF